MTLSFILNLYFGHGKQELLVVAKKTTLRYKFVTMEIMQFRIELTDSQLKVTSDIFSNLSAAWILAIFATFDPFTLTFNVVAATLSMYLSIKAEDIRKNHVY